MSKISSGPSHTKTEDSQQSLPHLPEVHRVVKKFSTVLEFLDWAQSLPNRERCSSPTFKISSNASGKITVSFDITL